MMVQTWRASPLIAKIIAFIATLIVAFALGFKTHDILIDRERIAALQAQLNLAKKQQAISNAIDSEHVKTQNTIQEQVKTIIKEVPIYVTKNDDQRCAVSAGTVRLLNRAADVPGTTSKLDAAPKTVAES
jgi:hypothetical protein